MYNLGEIFKPDLELAKTSVTTIFKGDKYRITVLSELLIRFEYNEKGLFEERPTEQIICRNFKTPLCTGKEVNGILIIETAFMRIEYAINKPFGGSKVLPGNTLRVTMNGTDKWWYYGNPEARNFGGTNYAIENNTRLSLQKGLFSQDGFATIDDSDSLIIEADGTLSKRETDGVDIYLFMYKDEFPRALNEYYRLTGYPPLIPRYALGIWYAKDKDMTSQEILEIADTFINNKIPLSVFYLTNKWHQQYGTPSGFTWNQEKIPDPKLMIDNLHKLNIRFGLYINPIAGIQPQEQLYSKAANYLEVPNDQVIPCAPYDPKWLDVYLKLFLHPLEAVGVDFFINDFAETDYFDMLSVFNHYHYLDHNRSINRRGLIMARNGLKAAHRYPINYTGNNLVSWQVLSFLPKFNYSAANIGLSWITNDIGGFIGGVEDPELYQRYVQLGCFSPILRFNSAESKYYKREPWLWDVETFTIAKKYLQLRHKLIPYIYTEAYNYHKTGTPLLKPLYYQDVTLYDSTLYDNQYMFGSQLLVAPITVPKDPLIGRTVHRFFIPQGVWYDFENGKHFMGDKNYIAFVKGIDYPVFAKAGAIIPMAKYDHINDSGNPKNLELHIFPGDNNTFELYEDDGYSNKYKQNDNVITKIKYTYQPDNYEVDIHLAQAKPNIIPLNRNYLIYFRNIKLDVQVEVLLQNKPFEFIKYQDNNSLVVKIENVPTVMPLKIKCSGENAEINPLHLMNDNLDEIIQDLKIETKLKDKLNLILFTKEDVKKKRIKIKKLKRLGLDTKTINMFLRLLEYVEER